MTIREMQRNFMIKLRQFVEEPEIESDDVEYYLNRAQEEYVKQQHFVIRDNYRTENMNTIAIQRAIENLRSLIRKFIYTYTTSSNSSNTDLRASETIKNGLEVSLTDLPNPYAYYLRSTLQAGSIENSLTCKIIDPTLLGKYVLTKYNSGLFREPAVLIEGQHAIVIYPADLIPNSNYKYILSYISFPVAMSIQSGTSCQLPDHTHNEIVDIAVNLKVEDLQKSRGLGLDKSAPIQRSE